MKSISFLLLLTALFFNGCQFQIQSTPKQDKPKQTATKTIKQEVILQDNSFINNDLNNYSSGNLNEVIMQIAKQLLHSNTVKDKTTKIILTTFVNLDNLEETTTFGRMLSESMFNELHVNKFNVTDFRGQDAISVTKDGEFHITRETEKLKDTIETIEYILVGTYVKFENKSFLINSRIIDSISGNIISSSRVIYKPQDCTLYNLCPKKIIKKEKVIYQNPTIEKDSGEVIEDNPIMIIEDK
ncbi:MAG: FlgO family outer membrane protein [Campylobacterota bacterium]|nr:FlgO family outer membrane protein [Campylobacterota bacterium]